MKEDVEVWVEENMLVLEAEKVKKDNNGESNGEAIDEGYWSTGAPKALRGIVLGLHCLKIYSLRRSKPRLEMGFCMLRYLKHLFLQRCWI